MKSLLDVDPAWMRSDAPPVSSTWRWFYLERWLTSASLAAWQSPGRLALESDVSPGLGFILRSAAWLSVEAVWRDGCVREFLSPEDMRWARSFGLALTGKLDHDSSALRTRVAPQERRRLSLRRACRLAATGLSAEELVVLRLSLPPLHAQEMALSEADEARLAQVPEAKCRQLLKLAKWRAAVGLGVDLNSLRVGRPAAATEPISEGHFERIEPSFEAPESGGLNEY